MLNCCVDLEKVKETGITFSTFACLAKCQGLDVNAVHGSNSTIDDFRRVVKETCSSSTSEDDQPTSFLVVSYTRKVIGQTGTGHFSPIGAYDEESDYLLVLDTARFKYGVHWIPLKLMFDALTPLDPDTGKSRGYIVLSYNGVSKDRKLGNGQLSHLPLSVLFESKMSKDYLRRTYKQYLMRSMNDDDGEKINLSSVASFWTQNYTNNTFVWELIEPQLQPVDSYDIETVSSVRDLIKELIDLDLAKETKLQMPKTLFMTAKESSGFPGGECCTSSTCNTVQRLIKISPAEAIFVIYLASLPVDSRRDIVYRKQQPKASDVSDTVRQQLLAEASLISYALETCDLDI